MTDAKFTSIDLFAGPGGLCTGFRWAGIKALIAVEWTDSTVQTYSKSHNADILELEDYLEKKANDPNFHFAKSDKTLMIHGDIRKVDRNLIMKILHERFDRESVDIVTGGAPCESFSMAGDRKEDDYRNVLYTNVLRIARVVDSKMFLFENVKGLFSKKTPEDKLGMFHFICEDFQSIKTDSEGKELPSFTLASDNKQTVLLHAIDYGVPQARERLFLVGINRKFPNGIFNYPKPTHGVGDGMLPYVTVEDALMDLPQVESKEENNHYDFQGQKVNPESPNHDYLTPEREDFLSKMRGYSLPVDVPNFDKEHGLSYQKGPGHITKMMNRIKAIKIGENMRTAYERLLKEGRKEFVKENFPKKIYGARNRRLVPEKPSFTVTSHCLDEMIHPYLDRGLTPREAARLQSFPDWYNIEGPYVKFHGDFEQDKYEQIGDAIPPLLAYAIGKEVVKTLKTLK